MKLGLKLIRLDGRETKKSCLLFKAKGVMHGKCQTNIFMSALILT